ncbi:aminopeptidase P family protein [Rickettsiales bacterium LUAb2]
MLEKIINQLRVSNIQNVNTALNFTKHLLPNLNDSEFKTKFTPLNLADYDLITKTSSTKIDKLKQQLNEYQIDALIISTNDEYLNEYTPLFANRLFYITGFNGSYGFAVITKFKSAIFVDGRYIEQAKKQVDSNIFQIIDFSLSNIVKFITDNLSTNQTVGIDSKSTAISLVKYFEQALAKANLKINYLTTNLIDNIWDNQPPKPLAPVSVYSIEYAGEEATAKINKITKFINEYKLDYCLFTAIDEIAWLLNIRGEDIACSPLVLSTLIVDKNGISQLFINQQKLLPLVTKYLEQLNIKLIDENNLLENLEKISNKNIGIFVDSPYFYQHILQKNNSVNVITKDSPIKILKCIKNNIEQQNTVKAHIKDGVALTKLIMWINKSIKSKALTEIEIANKLEEIKLTDPTYKGKSFDSIVAAGSNAAFPHYHPTLENNGIIEENTCMLIDCGGQYLEGTTDVTRVLSFNNPSDEFKKAFTLVLKGFINLSKAVFPDTCTGGNLDALARQFLWAEGEDYSHGTGHGVGHYLSVHEGPVRFSMTNNTTLKSGMIISVEPGCYKLNKFGIRIENLVLVQNSSKYDNYLELKYLTLVPIDTKNIMVNLLNESDIAWLNKYHTNVFNALSPYLTTEEVAELKALTKAI